MTTNAVMTNQITNAIRVGIDNSVSLFSVDNATISKYLKSKFKFGSEPLLLTDGINYFGPSRYVYDIGVDDDDQTKMIEYMIIADQTVSCTDLDTKETDNSMNPKDSYYLIWERNQTSKIFNDSVEAILKYSPLKLNILGTKIAKKYINQRDFAIFGTFRIIFLNGTISQDQINLVIKEISTQPLCAHLKQFFPDLF